jgi:hypothetical protein
VWVLRVVSKPMFHIGFTDTVVNVLRCVSYHTSRLLIDRVCLACPAKPRGRGWESLSDSALDSTECRPGLLVGVVDWLWPLGYGLPGNHERGCLDSTTHRPGLLMWLLTALASGGLAD